MQPLNYLKNLNLKFSIYIITGVVTLSILIYLHLMFSPVCTLHTPVEVTVEKGMSLKSITRLLYENGVISKPGSFHYISRITGSSRELKAGRYLFDGKISHYRILRKLAKGEVERVKITFPEGIRASSVASVLRERMSLDSTRIMDLIFDEEFIKSMHIDASSLEGYIYPNTYFFDYDISEEDAIKIMVDHFFELFNDSLMNRAREINMSLHNVVTLASIVEGEALIDEERPIISALYQNRLRKRMRLEADPTIQYIITNGPRRLLNKDLAIESPYNTYLHYGLPPGPVNNPGIKSIKAVLYPADTQNLFMVANGDGSHTFSRTFNEHIKAKNAFDAYRRQVRRSR